MPRGPVISRMVDMSKEKKGLDNGRVGGSRQQEKNEIVDPFQVGNTEWYLSKAIVASATLPWIPPAMVRPSMATCCTYTLSFKKTQMYFLCVGEMGELQ